MRPSIPPLVSSSFVHLCLLLLPHSTSPAGAPSPPRNPLLHARGAGRRERGKGQQHGQPRAREPHPWAHAPTTTRTHTASDCPPTIQRGRYCQEEGKESLLPLLLHTRSTHTNTKRTYTQPPTHPLHPHRRVLPSPRNHSPSKQAARKERERGLPTLPYSYPPLPHKLQPPFFPTHPPTRPDEQQQRWWWWR